MPAPPNPWESLSDSPPNPWAEDYSPPEEETPPPEREAQSLLDPRGLSGKEMLGASLKAMGETATDIIDDYQLQSALSYQRNWGGRLGSCLIKQ